MPRDAVQPTGTAAGSSDPALRVLRDGAISAADQMEATLLGQGTFVGGLHPWVAQGEAQRYADLLAKCLATMQSSPPASFSPSSLLLGTDPADRAAEERVVAVVRRGDLRAGDPESRNLGNLRNLNGYMRMALRDLTYLWRTDRQAAIELTEQLQLRLARVAAQLPASIEG